MSRPRQLPEAVICPLYRHVERGRYELDGDPRVSFARIFRALEPADSIECLDLSMRGEVGALEVVSVRLSGRGRRRRYDLGDLGLPGVLRLRVERAPQPGRRFLLSIDSKMDEVASTAQLEAAMRRLLRSDRLRLSRTKLTSVEVYAVLAGESLERARRAGAWLVPSDDQDEPVASVHTSWFGFETRRHVPVDLTSRAYVRDPSPAWGDVYKLEVRAGPRKGHAKRVNEADLLRAATRALRLILHHAALTVAPKPDPWIGARLPGGRTGRRMGGVLHALADLDGGAWLPGLHPYAEIRRRTGWSPSHLTDVVHRLDALDLVEAFPSPVAGRHREKLLRRTDLACLEERRRTGLPCTSLVSPFPRTSTWTRPPVGAGGREAPWECDPSQRPGWVNAPTRPCWGPWGPSRGTPRPAARPDEVMIALGAAELRASGRSRVLACEGPGRPAEPAEIAELFNANAIPTLRGRPWDGGSVSAMIRSLGNDP